jgi:prepilin-type N-terminal cleavage/methylation domain-containing protein
VKPIRDNSNKKAGFTIVELLTVMSIIVILISLLMPALNRVRRYATRVKQKAQFHSIGVALDLFNAENEGYPPSDRTDPTPVSYCGAMKLAEAMVGQDLMGFNLNSRFYRNGTSDGLTPTTTNSLYPVNPGTGDLTAYSTYVNSIKARKMYLDLEKANAYRLTDIYTSAHLASTSYAGLTATDCNLVLCDAYVRTMATGNKLGMPILYYKADTNKNEHDANLVTDCKTPTNNIYNRCDNQELVDIPLPWVSPPSTVHPMATTGITPTGAQADPTIFYTETRNEKVTTGTKSHMADSYILMSAGFDGEYGTSDDIFNFGD